MKKSNEPFKDKSNFNFEEFISTICDRIEIGISDGFYPAPSDLFMKNINSLGFPNIKSFLISASAITFQQLDSKTSIEMEALNFKDLYHPSFREYELIDFDNYPDTLVKIFIYELTSSIRTFKANNKSMTFSDLNSSLSALKNLADDSSYFDKKNTNKEEIAYLIAEIQKPIISKTSEPIEIEIAEYFKNKTNKFNKVPLEQVAKYFMQLAEEPENPFLKREDVFKFIDKAFCGNNKIKPLTLDNTNRKKGLIWQLFYNFFIECTTDSAFESTKHSKEKYVRLLTSNFGNWAYKSVFDNFSTSNSKYWKKLKEFK